MLQRVMIAMSLILRPKLLLADEPITSLDLRTSSIIMHLFKEFHAETKATIIFVTHDLEIVENFANYVLIMNLGEIVEQGRTEDIFRGLHKHPYTEDLLKSKLELSNTNSLSEIYHINGEIKTSYYGRMGCCYFDRCKYKEEICSREVPVSFISSDHAIKCYKFCKNE